MHWSMHLYSRITIGRVYMMNTLDINDSQFGYKKNTSFNHSTNYWDLFHLASHHILSAGNSHLGHLTTGPFSPNFRRPSWYIVFVYCLLGCSMIIGFYLLAVMAIETNIKLSTEQRFGNHRFYLFLQLLYKSLCAIRDNTKKMAWNSRHVVFQAWLGW